MRVAVVGGGVVGLACAFELVRGGAEVVVLERDTIGHGASFGNTGWVCPSFTYPLPGPGIVGEGLRAAFSLDGPLAIRPGLDPGYLRWLLAFRRNCNRETWLHGMKAFVELGRPTTALLDGYRASGVEFELHDAGLLLVALDPKKLDAYAGIFRDLAALGFEGGLEEVSAGRVRELEPMLSAETSGGVLAQIDRWVQPLSLAQGPRDLARRTRGRGAEGNRGAHDPRRPGRDHRGDVRGRRDGDRRGDRLARADALARDPCRPGPRARLQRRLPTGGNCSWPRSVPRGRPRRRQRLRGRHPRRRGLRARLARAHRQAAPARRDAAHRRRSSPAGVRPWHLARPPGPGFALSPRTGCR